MNTVTFSVNRLYNLNICNMRQSLGMNHRNALKVLTPEFEVESVLLMLCTAQASSSTQQ